MDIQITVSCPDLVQAATIFANALQDLRFRASFASAQQPATAAGFPPEVREEQTAPAETWHDAETDAAAQQAPAPDPKPEPDKSNEAFTLEQVRAELTKLPTDKARSIITGFGAPKLTAVDPKHYPALMAKIKEAS
jgi:hypothetical protein